MSFLTIARKDLRVLLRDRTALIFIFALPLVFIFTFGFAFARNGSQSSSPLKALVANEDTGPQGKSLVDEMQKVGLTVVAAKGGDVAARVKKGEQAVGVVIPADFSAKLSGAINHAADGGDMEPVRLPVTVDPAQGQIAGMAQGAIFAATQRLAGPMMRQAALARVPQQFREVAAKQMNSGSGKAAVALDVVSQQTSEEKANKPSGGDLVIPGFMVYFVFFTANSVAITLIVERQEGTLRRMLSTPVSPAQILAGKMVARAFLALLQTVMLIVLGMLFFRMHLGSSPLGLVLTALATIFASTGLGLLIATMGRTQEQIQGMTTLLLLMMGIVSGCLYPRAFMPEAMQKLSLITPHAWALNAYQDLLLRKTTLLATLPNIGVVLLFGMGFYLLALKRFQFE